MPANKDLKRLVRRRMQKTGEAYTTARSHLLRAKSKAATPSVSPKAAEYAQLAGKSDAILKEKTGCDWQRWVKTLDGVKANTWSHAEIAKYVSQKYKVSNWWAQSVTVGYERIKGLRAIGQRRDSWYEANKSKTFNVPVARLYRAFQNPGLRGRWLSGVNLTIRKSTPEKSMRITWPDQTTVILGFLSKGPSKSQVAVQHERLRDRESSERMKQFWSARLSALGEVLSESPRRQLSATAAE